MAPLCEEALAKARDLFDLIENGYEKVEDFLSDLPNFHEDCV